MAINIMITDDHSMTVISRLLLRQRMVRTALIN